MTTAAASTAPTVPTTADLNHANRVREFLGVTGEVLPSLDDPILYVKGLTDAQLFSLGEKALQDIADEIIVLDEIRNRFREDGASILGYRTWTEFVERHSCYSLTIQNRLAEKNSKDTKVPTPAAPPTVETFEPDTLTFDNLLAVCGYPELRHDIDCAIFTYNQTQPQLKAEECLYEFKVEPMGIFDLTLEDLKYGIGDDPEDEARKQAIVDLLRNGGKQWPIICMGTPGESYVAEGLHRLLAADFLGLATIPVVYVVKPEDFGNESDESNDSMVWLNLHLRKTLRDNVIWPAIEHAKKHIALNADGEDVTDGAALELICGNFLSDPNFADPDEPQPSAEDLLRAQQGIDASCKMGMDVLYSESGTTPPLAS